MLSVTQILQPHTDFDAVHPDVLAYAAGKGTRFHTVIQQLLMGAWVPKVHNDIKGYVTSFKLFASQMIQETVFVEQEFTCNIYNFIGHIDWGGYLKDRPNIFTVLDWKTPVSSSPTWKGQLSAYKHLARQKYEVQRIGTFQPNKDGKVGKVIWYEDSAQAFEAFLCALTAMNYFSK